MIAWLPFISVPFVAIDLNAVSATLLELSGSYKHPKVAKFSLLPMPEGAVNNDLVVDDVMAGEVISASLKTSKIKAKSAAIAALSTTVIAKEVLMEKGLGEEDIESSAWVEMIKQFTDISDVSLDYELLGESKDDPEKQTVFIVACRNETLQKNLDALEHAGLKIKIIDVSHLAMARVGDFLLRQLPEHKPGHPIGLVHLGLEWTKKVVCLDGVVVHYFDHAFAGNEIFDQVKSMFNSDNLFALDEVDPVSIPDGVEAKYNELIIQLLLPQIERYINFFYTSSSAKSMSHLFLSGDCALLPNVDKIVQERLDIPTSIANPFLSMKVPSKMDKKLLYRQAPRFLVSCGLALHEVCHGSY